MIIIKMKEANHAGRYIPNIILTLVVEWSEQLRSVTSVWLGAARRRLDSRPLPLYLSFSSSSRLLLSKTKQMSY